ncbi:MAG: alpha/beta hydrolase [Acidobacteriota bacterium]
MLLMVTNRRLKKGRYSDEEQARQGYHYLIDHLGQAPGQDGFGSKVGKSAFRKAIVSELERQCSAPQIAEPSVGIYLHGYNNTWQESIDELVDLHQALAGVLGHDPFLIGFSWPSAGKIRSYLSDREEARDSVKAFTRFTLEIAEFVRLSQKDCMARSYCIAHSMGNYLLRKGFEYASDYLGEPVGLKLFDETLMLAADLASSDMSVRGKGRYIRDLSRRVHIYYSRHDSILRASSAKRFGRNRLGRHGIREGAAIDSNVVLIDTQNFARGDSLDQLGLTTRRGKPVSVHSAARYHPRILEDIRQVIFSTDRELVTGRERLDLDDEQRNRFRLV